jgi:hypothetical protein
MYPESNVTKADYTARAKIALIDYMVKGMDNAQSWYKWRDTTEQTLLTQQMNLIIAARRIFTDEGVPRDQHQEFLKNPTIIGTDCIKSFTNKLRTRNTPWDLSLLDMIQEKINTIKPVPINLLDLQKSSGQQNHRV